MPKYAYYDSTVAALSPVLAWYDTDNFKYSSLPAVADLLEISETQWDARLTNPSGWAVSAGALVAYTPPAPTAAQLFATLQLQAQMSLTDSDKTILRCYENAVIVPSDWAAYRADLRAIVNGSNSTATVLPTMPAYPAGT
jgi:hypothetical protein